MGLRKGAAVVATGALLALVVVSDVASAQAGTWYVAPGGSDGSSCAAPAEPCATIDGAIAKATAGDVVRVAVGTYAGTGEQVVLVDESVALDGGWDSGFTSIIGSSTIDGEDARRGVLVASGVTALIAGFTVERGMRPTASPTDGGGISNFGDLVVLNSVVRLSQGGGIVNYAELTLLSSTVHGNTSTISSAGGGITSSGQGNPVTRIVNSTVTGNTSTRAAGILVGRPVTGGATLSLHNATVWGNVSLNEEIEVQDFTSVTMESSIVGYTSTFGSVVSHGYNLLEGLTGTGWTAGPGDAFVDPQLGPLGDNGGPTETMAPAFWSDAIDGGNPAGCTDESGDPLTTDQRGAPRDTHCDIGAFEAVPPPNDDFADAVALDGLASPLAAENVYATKEPLEPWHGSDAGGASVWFTWTPTFTGTGFASTSGSDFDTMLGVYTGSSVSALTALASNDDASVAARGGFSRVCFPVVAGTQYRIAVDGWGAANGYDLAEGSVQLQWGQYTGSDPCQGLPPVVVGQPRVGQPSSATTGTWTGVIAGHEYQWLVCPAVGGCYAVPGATGPTYTPTADLVGQSLAVEVIARHPSDPTRDAAAQSVPSLGILAAAPPPSGGGGGGGGGGAPPDLQLAKTASVSTAAVGDTILYRLQVRVKNAAQTSGASRVLVTDVLPANVELVSTKVNRGPGCAGTRTITCNMDFLGGDLVAVVELVVRVTAPGTVVNTASVAAFERDPNLADNTATATVTPPATSTPTPTPPLAVPAPRLTHRPAAANAVLRVSRAGTTASVATRVALDRAATVTLRVRDPRTGARLTLQPGSTIATTTLGRKAQTAKASVTRAGVFPVRLVLPARQVGQGKAYQLVLTATGANGKASTLTVRFRG